MFVETIARAASALLAVGTGWLVKKLYERVLLPWYKRKTQLAPVGIMIPPQEDPSIWDDQN